MNEKTFIADLTVEEFRELVSSTIRDAQLPRRRNLVRGIEGIANTLRISTSEAKRIKARGILDRAIIQSGRVILTDADMALKLYQGSRKN